MALLVAHLHLDMLNGEVMQEVAARNATYQDHQSRATFLLNEVQTCVASLEAAIETCLE